MTTGFLFRQIHPHFFQDGRVISTAFKPTPKDERHLSAYNGEKFDAESAYRHFVQNPKCESIGVLHTTRNICAEIDLEVIDDNEPFDGHSSIVFGAKLTNSQIEKTAKKLTKQAWDCGWDYYAGSDME